MPAKPPNRPRRPSSPDPPADLAAAAAALVHPKVTRSGLTTTADGQWALMVRVKPGTATPLRAVEKVSGGHPVVYEDEPAESPVARPAYPKRGE